MNNDFDYQIIARKIIPYINDLSAMYKQGTYNDDDEIVGSVASTVKAFKKNKSKFYNNNDLIDDDENKEENYIHFLENELTNLLTLVYHVHKGEFDQFVDDASKLETDDIISSICS